MKRRSLNRAISCLLVGIMVFFQSIAVFAESTSITPVVTTNTANTYVTAQTTTANTGNTLAAPTVTTSTGTTGTTGQSKAVIGNNALKAPASAANTGTLGQPLLGIVGNGNIGTNSFLNLFGSDKNKLTATLRENGVAVNGDKLSVTDPNAFITTDAARALNEVFNKTLNANNVLAANTEKAAADTTLVNSAVYGADKKVSVNNQVYRASGITAGISKIFTPIAVGDAAFNADIIANGDMKDYAAQNSGQAFPANRSWAGNTTNANILQVAWGFYYYGNAVLAAEDYRGNQNPDAALPGSLPMNGLITTVTNPRPSGFIGGSGPTSAFGRGYFGTNTYLGERLVDSYADPDVPINENVNVDTTYNFQLRDYNGNNAIHKANEAFSAEFTDQTKSYSSIAALYADQYQYIGEGTYYVNFADGSSFDVYTNETRRAVSSNIGFNASAIPYGTSVLTEDLTLGGTIRRFDEVSASGTGMSIMVIHLPAEYHNKIVTGISGKFSGDILAISGVEAASLSKASTDPGLYFTDITDISAVLNWKGLRYYTQTLENNKFTDYEIEVAADQNFTQLLQGYPKRISAAGETTKDYPWKQELFGLVKNTTYYARIRTAHGNLHSDWYTVATMVSEPDKTITYSMGSDPRFTFDALADPYAVVDTTLYHARDSILLPEAPATWFGTDINNNKYVFDHWDIGGVAYYPGQSMLVKAVLDKFNANVLEVTAKYRLEPAVLPNFGAGDGSAANPYRIQTADDLILLMKKSKTDNFAGTHFFQTADIDLAGREGEIFPIGGIGDGCSFQGYYDSSNVNQKRIINYRFRYNVGTGTTITAPVYIGLFGHVESNNTNGQIKNIKLINAKFEVENCTNLNLGAIAGYIHENSAANTTSLQSCLVDSASSIRAVDCAGYVGGIVGRCSSAARKSFLTELANKGSIYAKNRSDGSQLFAGGLIGFADLFGELSNSYNQGDLTSDNNAKLAGILADQTWKDQVAGNGVYDSLDLVLVYNAGRQNLVNFDESKNPDDYTRGTANGFLDRLGKNKFFYITDGRTVNGKKVDFTGPASYIDYYSEPYRGAGRTFSELLKGETYYVANRSWNYNGVYDVDYYTYYNWGYASNGNMLTMPYMSSSANGGLPYLPYLDSQVSTLGDGVVTVDAVFVAGADQISTLNIGASKSIKLITQPANIPAASFIWSSSNPAVCSVDANGTVTAKLPGVVEITIYAKDNPANRTAAQVIVNGTNTSGVNCAVNGDVNNKLITLQKGDSFAGLTAIVSPAGAAVPKVVWASANPAVAAVAVDAVTGAVTVTGVNKGKTYITVTTVDGSYTDKVLVTVAGISVASIVLGRDSLSFDAGSDGATPASATITKTVTMSDNTTSATLKVNWESSDQSVAVVSPDGEVFPTGFGTAAIIAKSTDGAAIQSNACTVTVNAVRVASVAPTVTAVTVPKKNVLKLSVDIAPANALNKRLTWVSSDPSVAYVNENGYVTTLKKGTVQITATSVDNPSCQAVTTVTVVAPVLGIRMLNKSRFTKLGVNKEREIGTIEVYPSDAEDLTYTLTNSNPEVASIVNGKLTTHKAGQTRITAATNSGNKVESVVLTVLEERKIKVTVKDIVTNSPVSGAVVNVFGETFTTDAEGKTVVKIPPDEPESIIKISKDGYREKRVMEGFMYSGAYTLYLKPDNGQPYFGLIGYTEDYENYESLEEMTKATDKDKKVKIWTAIDWKGHAPGDVFLERGPAKLRMAPMSDNRYQIGYGSYYDIFNSKDGDYTIKATSTDGTELVIPLKWGYLDYDGQVANVKLDQGDSNFTKTSGGGSTDGSMYNTGFDMKLPDGLPISLQINGSKLYLAVQWSASWSKAPGDEKFQRNPEAGDYAKAIKESISSGKMSQKLKDLTKAPPMNKVEKRIEVAVEIMGYVEGDFVKTTSMVDLASLKASGALKYFGIDDAKYDVLNKAFPSGLIPITNVALQVANAGIKVTVDGKLVWSQQFMAGPIPVYVETSIGASIDQLLALEFKNSEVQFRGKTGVTPYFNVYGAVGIGGVMTVGPSLDGRLPIQVTYPKPRHFTVDLNISLGIKVVFLCFDKKYKIFNGNWNLVDLADNGAEAYDNTGEGPSQSSPRTRSVRASSKRPSTVTGEAIMDGFEPMQRRYLSAKTYPGDGRAQSEYAQRTVLSPNAEYNEIKMTFGYPEMMPKLTGFYNYDSNVYEMLVWEDDDESRNALNRTKLNFSVRNNDNNDVANAVYSWSIPKAVENDGTADGRFEIAAPPSQQAVYIAYEDLAKELAYDDQHPAAQGNATFKDFVDGMRISLAKYNGISNSFETPIDLSDLATKAEIADPSVTAAVYADKIMNANNIDYLPQIAANGSEVVVTWIRNSNGDFTGLTGRTSIKKATITASGEARVEEVFSGISTPVLYQSAGYAPNSAQPTIAYMTDGDNNYSTMTDRSLYVVEGSKAAVKAATDSVPGIIDNPQLSVVDDKLMLLWYNTNGNIYYIPDASKSDDLKDAKAVRAVFPSNPEAQYNDNGTKEFPATSAFKIISGKDNMGKTVSNALIYKAGSGVVTGRNADGSPQVKPVQEVYLVTYDKQEKAFGGYTTNLSRDGSLLGSTDGYINTNSNWINLACTTIIDLDAGNQTLKPYEHDTAAKLKVLRINPQPDLEVKDGVLLYNPENVNNAAESVYVSVFAKNIGQAAVKGVKLKLRNSSDQLIGSREFPEAVLLPEGEEQEFGMDYTWAKPLTEHTVTAKILPLDAASEADPTNNSGTAVFGGVNLRLDAVTTSTFGKFVVVNGSIQNNSDKRAEGLTVKLYKMASSGNKTGDALKTLTVGDLDPYYDTGFSFDLDPSQINFNDDADDAYNLQRNKYVLEVTAGNSTDVSDYDNKESVMISNPYAQVLPFTVSANDLVASDGAAVLKLAVTNNLPVDNSGTLAIRVVNQNGEQLATAEKEIAVNANETKPAEVTLENFGALTEPYMVFAGFKSASAGTPLSDGNTSYYSNVTYGKVADFKLSDNNKLSGLTFTNGTLAEKSTSAAINEYELKLSGTGSTSTVMNIVAEDAFGALISYQVNNGEIKYLTSGENSEAISVAKGDIINVVVRAVNGDEKTYRINTIGSGDSSGGGSSPIPVTPTTSVDIMVNGKTETVGTATTATNTSGQTITTISVDSQQLEQRLNQEGSKAVVSIQVNNGSDGVIGQLNGQTVKNMETKEAVLEITTGNVTYTLPASQINIDNVASQMGKQVELKDIVVNVQIAAPTAKIAKIVQDTANKNNYQVVVKPVTFEITCTSGNKTVEVSKLNGYVERTIAIPDGVDPSKITTGVVLNADGTFSHVPTTIVIKDGKYYAKINSLTNSTYSVIWGLKTFTDVESHWAKDAVNDMGSRLVVNGVGDGKFEPDRDITRAEFAAIVVKGLGLMRPGTGKDSFKDVTKDAWYYDAVSIAFGYGIINGYGGGKFGPADKITREQAMAMIARAMNITWLKAELANGETDKLLEAFTDASISADYAKNSIAACIKTGIVSGRNGNMIAPKDNITRGEVAVIVRRLLQKSKLI